MSDTFLAEYVKRYYIYRNPTPSSVEVLNESWKWVNVQGNTDNLLGTTDYSVAKMRAQTHNGKVATRDQLDDMIDALNMLAKWKKANEDKEAQS